MHLHHSTVCLSYVSTPHRCYVPIPPTSGRLCSLFDIPIFLGTHPSPMDAFIQLFLAYLLQTSHFYQTSRVWPIANWITWTKSHHHISLGAVISLPNIQDYGFGDYSQGSSLYISYTRSLKKCIPFGDHLRLMLTVTQIILLSNTIKTIKVHVKW